MEGSFVPLSYLSFTFSVTISRLFLFGINLHLTYPLPGMSYLL
jgi:hypothetical protein